MTGLYPRRLGILHNPDKSSVIDEVVSLQSVLKDNGYYTAAFGKRHLKGSADLGWDYHRGHSKRKNHPATATGNGLSSKDILMSFNTTGALSLVVNTRPQILEREYRNYQKI
jgi:arylsulfatase A-like enzyme